MRRKTVNHSILFYSAMKPQFLSTNTFLLVFPFIFTRFKRIFEIEWLFLLRLHRIRPRIWLFESLNFIRLRTEQIVFFLFAKNGFLCRAHDQIRENNQQKVCWAVVDASESAIKNQLALIIVFRINYVVLFNRLNSIDVSQFSAPSSP